MAGDRTFSFETSWGANYAKDETVFRIWTPSAEKVELALGSHGTEDFLSMQKNDGGWWEIRIVQAKPGLAYGFRFDGGEVLPDPAARAQVSDVHGRSQLVDPKEFQWQTADWTGRPWHEAVVYELHTGTFTPEGTFDAIIGKLDHLKNVGITAIELLPVAQYEGRHGWGYDGVLLYCPHEAYGGAGGLKRFVDAAHQRGLMVFLDVVYNHFGPAGNYIPSYLPEFFHAEIRTPWGPAIAYDKEPVRRFMIENALYWLSEYQIDGLRLDAIDSIKDAAADVPLVRELASRVRESITDRYVHITTEDERNITWHVDRGEENSIPLVSGEWNDDFHHTAHVIATGEQEGYYADYETGSAEQMARALASGFVFQGQYSKHRASAVGSDSSHLPPTAFVNFIQNHDQIGNRAFGDRLRSLASSRAYQCIQAILLLSPQIPLLFQGEEYGDINSFCFFTDFHGQLGEAVSTGRREEFKGFSAFEDKRAAEIFPDPNDEETFATSKLDWSQLSRPVHRRELQITQALLTARREVLMPLLQDVKGHCGSALVDERAFAVVWQLQSGKAYHLFANLSDKDWNVKKSLLADECERAELVYSNCSEPLDRLRKASLPPWSVVFCLTQMPLIETDDK